MTFDYNYVRVVGAVAKKCYCGSPQCRGYIGGDPHKNEGHPPEMLSDSDEDYPEPRMLTEDGGALKSMGNIKQKANSSDGVIAQISESKVEKRDEIDNCIPALGKLEISTGKGDCMNYSTSAVSLVDDALELDLEGKLSSSNRTPEISQQTQNVTRKLTSAVHQESSVQDETMDKSPSSSLRFNRTTPVELLSKSLSNGVDVNRRSKSDIADDRLISPEAHPNVKSSHSSSVYKKGKVKSTSPNNSKVQLAANKSQPGLIKPKKAIEGSFGNRFEAG